MSKMSIAEAAEHFGVSREAIHNRIRRGSLESVVEDGVKFVFVEANKPKRALNRSAASKMQSTDARYFKLLEEQNAKLQERVEKLEGETRTLRDQKEQMLIEERIKIEQIYKDKDEQLKNILTSISSQFMLSLPQEQEQELKIEEEALEAEIESEEIIESQVVSLKKYLKKNKISEKKSKKIKAKFKKESQRDNRIITIGKKHYMNLSKYDYKNLLN